jgi:hypothetical protein
MPSNIFVEEIDGGPRGDGNWGESPERAIEANES